MSLPTSKIVASWLGLKHEEDLRTLGFAGAYFTLLPALWHLHDSHFYVALCFYPLLILLSFIGATTTHNAMHCPLFKRRRSNQFFQVLLSLTYGHPVSSYVPGHNLSHHKYTQLRKDVMRTTRMRYKWNLLNGLFFQSSIVYKTVLSDIKFLKVQQKLGRPFFEQAFKEFFWVLFSTVVLLTLNPRKFLIYWFIPHNFAQWAIVSINLIQHDGCEVLRDPTGKADWKDTPNTARDFTGSTVNFLTNNNGFHSIHHLHPELHWSKLPEAHAREIAPYQHPNLQQGNILAFIFKYFIYPGRREMYDGRDIVFDSPKVLPDIEWMTYPKGIKKEDVEMDFFGSLFFVADATLFAACKIISPSWSPEPHKNLL